MHRIGVQTGRATYDVIVERGAIDHAAEYLAPILGKRRAFVVADNGSWAAQGERLSAGLEGIHTTVLRFRGGEERKRLAEVENLANQMYAAGADRSACVIAFGGGIVGDMGGFLAASYMRGVDVIQIPTTLLAQVDAAIGGKTGVNLSQGKNLFGSFHQPRLVLMDPVALDTLPEREYRAGLYEVIKSGIIRSRSLFSLLVVEREAILKRDPALLESVIADCARIKAEVVSADEREGDLRRILNYGHTLGHALEAETGYHTLLHGEAVAFGMIAAGRLAEFTHLLTPDTRQAIEQTILDYGPIPPIQGVSGASLEARLGGDKKTIGGKIHFVLAEGIGHVRVVSGIEPGRIIAAADAALKTVGAA